MSKHRERGENYLSELRLLLEELCCDLCRFEFVTDHVHAAKDVQIEREFYLGIPGSYADLRVAPPGQPPYFVEVKFGYPNDMLVHHLRRKYGAATPALQDATRLVLVLDVDGRPNWPQFKEALGPCLRPGLALELWDEVRLGALLKERFDVEVRSITEENLLDVRQAIDRAKGFHAFGGTSLADYENDPLRSELLWHFGFWRLRELRDAGRKTPRAIFPPGMYRGVVVVLADLCSFSSYVRDTRDDAVVRHCLTSFYSKTRYQILNNGGMHYQFVGDEVIGMFGVPEAQPDTVRRALQTARALVNIGYSVSNHWQRHIDRVQASGGLHVGMALGDLQFVSFRPFSRTHMGAIGDAINVAARLMTAAGSGDIVVSNSLYHSLADEDQTGFAKLEPVEARNIGLIKGWKLSLQQAL